MAMKNGKVPNPDSIHSAIDEALVYPVLTEEMGGSASTDRSSSTSVAIPGTAPLGQIAESAIRQALGWRPRANDAKGFAAALNQSFALKTVNGYTEITYTPRGFAVQADLGAVTGAQAAIYRRAKVMLDQVLPLLDGLMPLNDPDAEDVEAARVLVRNALNGLVNELAAEGGPRVARVDDYCAALLDDGHLDTLKERLGLESDHVNTIEEELNLTNFIVMEQYVDSLRDSWDDLKHFFDREGGDVFLGTQSVRLSRELDVLAESVQEAYEAMNSVFLGPAERQTTQLNFGANETPMTIAELFDWISHAATEEIPHLIQDAGKDGVAASTPLLSRLLNLITTATPEPDTTNPPYNTRRVKRAVAEVQGHLQAALNLAKDVRRTQPAPKFVPNQMIVVDHMTDDLVRMTAQVTQLQDGAQLQLQWHDPSRGLIRKIGSFISLNLTSNPPTISAIFDTVGKINNRPWTLVVTNWDEQSDSVEFDPYSAKQAATAAAPIVIHMTERRGTAGMLVMADLYGDDFTSSSTVEIGDTRDGVQVETMFVNASRLTLAITIGVNTPAGPKQVRVKNADGQVSQSKVTFDVVAPPNPPTNPQPNPPPTP